MPRRDWRLRIKDILDSIENIRNYTAGMEYNEFVDDRRTIDAVVRNIIIIGEAANHVSEVIQRRNKDIPWKVLRDIRNVVVHEYFGIDKGIVWSTAKNDLPPLVNPLKEILEQS